MTPEQELNRLRWRCRRGMRELDALLIGFVDRHYLAAQPAEQAAFRRLLTLPDPDIVGLLNGRLASEDAGTKQLLHRIVAQRVSPAD